MMIDPNSKLKEYYNCCFPQDKAHKTPLSKALAKGDEKVAQELISSMEKEGVECTQQERWQIKVLNLDFNDMDFLALTPQMQSLIYRTANNFNNIPLVTRLNALGNYNIADVFPKGPCIISLRMDIASINQILFEFLVKLRQENRLVTENEFQDLQQNQSWIKKGKKIPRILGCDYISQLTEKLNLKHIKVPEKKGVISSNTETLSIEIEEHGNNGLLVDAYAKDITIYAQKIQKTNRLLSREEISELFIIIEAANFTDLWDHNFIVAEDGIYFIDTEIKSFDHSICWNKMERLKCFMSEEDQEWFFQQIEQRIRNQLKPNLSFGYFFANSWVEYGKIEESPRSIECKQIYRQYKLVGANKFAIGGRAFSFPVHEIIRNCNAFHFFGSIS